MVRAFPIPGLLLVVLLCVAADFARDALQSGYAAYLRQDYDAACIHYEQALKNSPDPGRIACELGALFAKAERYQEAAAWFTRSLEDAAGERRVKSAYGQGTALTHVAAKYQGRRAVTLLQQALQSYEVARREYSSLSPEELTNLPTLKTDIEHNRSIAQGLLAQKQKEPEPPDTTENEMPPESGQLPLNDPGRGAGNGSRALPLNGRNNPANGSETGTNDSNAGRGNLPPLPDDDQAPPLSPEEAHRRLDQLLQRLLKPLPQQATRPGTKDW